MHLSMLESENTPQTSDEPQGKALSYGPELRLGLAVKESGSD